MDIQEIEVYKQRVQKQYEEMLSYREDIVKEQELEEKRLAELQEKRKQVEIDINNDIALARQKIGDFKKEKEQYEHTLGEREDKISLKLIHLEEREVEIERELKDHQLAKGQYLSAVKGIKEEREHIAEEQKRINLEKEIWNNMVAKEQQKLNELTSLKKELEMKNAREDKYLRQLEIQQLQLTQQLEAVTLKDNELNKKSIALEKEQKHLYSQQGTLKRAYEQLKKLKNNN
jgi:chromosome segregation ATPase